MSTRLREFLAAPRHSEAIPNSEGTYALYNISTYSFTDHNNEIGVHVTDLKSRRSWALTRDTRLKEHTWTGFGSDVLSLKRVGDSTEFWIDNVDNVASPGQKYVLLLSCISAEVVADKSEEVTKQATSMAEYRS
jgi:hypothetical protein